MQHTDNKLVSSTLFARAISDAIELNPSLREDAENFVRFLEASYVTLDDSLPTAQFKNLRKIRMSLLETIGVAVREEIGFDEL